MAISVPGKPGKNYQATLRDLQKVRKSVSDKKRKDKRGYSLEGLRFASLLNQLQALQAIQGLKEIRPRQSFEKSRFEIPKDPIERANQRRWLMFKADWLEALLEDTVKELEAMNRYEGLGDALAPEERRAYPRKDMEVLARYQVIVDGTILEWQCCMILDASAGGMKLLTNEKISQQQNLQVRFQNTDLLAAKVVWVKEVDDQVCYHAGVNFENPPEIAQRHLEKLIDTYNFS
jgi:hypothetical protein